MKNTKTEEPNIAILIFNIFYTCFYPLNLLREVKESFFLINLTQTSAGYSQNNTKLARYCSDCNQHKFG